MVSHMFIIQTGLAAGIVAGMFAMLMHMLKLTTLNLTEYTGCMLTNQKSGMVPFVAGFANHLIASTLFAFAYVQIIQYFDLGLNLKTGILMGIAHTVFSGLLMMLLDYINPCVASKKVSPLGLMAQNHGVMGIVVFVLVHIIYAIVLVKLLTLGSLLMFMNMLMMFKAQEMIPDHIDKLPL